MTKLQTASNRRDARLADAQTAYSATVSEINTEFAGEIRRAILGGKSITEIAQELGSSRQTVHDLLRRVPAAAKAA